MIIIKTCAGSLLAQGRVVVESPSRTLVLG